MAHKVDIYVGGQLRKRRKEIGMSQGELGNKLKVTFQQIQKYEKGTNRIGASRLFELSNALGVPVSYFFSGLDEDENGAGEANGTNGALNAELMRLVKAFNEIDDPQVLNDTVHLIEGIAEKTSHCRSLKRRTSRSAPRS